MRVLLLLCSFYCWKFGVVYGSQDVSTEQRVSQDLFDIEGEVVIPEYATPARRDSWLKNTKVSIKGGQYVGVIKEDGSFVIPKVPSDAYIIEVISPDYVYEPVRVDITTKGKIRARKLSYLQPSQVVALSYPLKFRTSGLAAYFQPREQWRIADFLLSPMVLMMVLPLLLIMILPRLINENDAKKEMEQMQTLPRYDVPEVSEMITTFFSGGDKKGAVAKKQVKKIAQKQN